MAPQKPKLTIRINGMKQNLNPASSNTNNVAQDAETHRNSEDSDDAENIKGDMAEDIEKFLDDCEVDAEDGPDWMFEADEMPSKDPNYVFCPAAH